MGGPKAACTASPRVIAAGRLLSGDCLPVARNASICRLRLSCALRLAVQDAALSRRKHGFDSRRARQQNQRLREFPPDRVQQLSNIGRWVLVDWLSPDTWKSTADLVTDWKALGTFALAIGGALWRWGGKLWRWLIPKLQPMKSAAPVVAGTADRPLIFVVDDNRATHGPVGADEKTGTYVIGVWDVTNVSNSNFVLLKVRLGNHASRSSVVGVQRSDGAYQVKGALSARRIMTVKIEVAFTPAIHVPGKDLIEDVIFTDNYGDEHKLPSVRFRRRGLVTTAPDERSAPGLPTP